MFSVSVALAFVLSEWLTSHGAKPVAASDESTECSEIELGPTKTVALRCSDIVHETRGTPTKPGHVYRVTTHERIWIVRGGRAQRVFDAATSVFALDSVDENGSTPIVRLEARMASDGRSLEIADNAARPCATVRAELATYAKDVKDDPVMRPWAALDRELASRVCRNVGTYDWKNGRFVKR